MPRTESELALIVVGILVLASWLSRQDIRRFFVLFPLGCLTGWIAQLALGPDRNFYTPNVSLYVNYVSVAVILAWGAGLSSMWALHLVICRITGRRPNAGLYILAGFPATMILEYVGTTVLGMRLHDYQRYPPLMPSVDSMHAPLWYYEYYILVAIVFYLMLTALRINTGDWSRARIRLPIRSWL